MHSKTSYKLDANEHKAVKYVLPEGIELAILTVLV